MDNDSLLRVNFKVPSEIEKIYIDDKDTSYSLDAKNSTGPWEDCFLLNKNKQRQSGYVGDRDSYEKKWDSCKSQSKPKEHPPKQEKSDSNIDPKNKAQIGKNLSNDTDKTILNVQVYQKNNQGEIEELEAKMYDSNIGRPKKCSIPKDSNFKYTSISAYWAKFNPFHQDETSDNTNDALIISGKTPFGSKTSPATIKFNQSN